MYHSDDNYRDFYGTISGSRRLLAADTGLITLVPAVPKHTIFIQKIHAQVSTLTASEVWGFQDSAGTPVPIAPVSAAAVENFTYDFGPMGIPCTEGTAFVLNITGAVGAAGWIAWEGYKKLTLGAAA